MMIILFLPTAIDEELERFAGAAAPAGARKHRRGVRTREPNLMELAQF
jgi:hypothetical protein